ncbi:FAD-dependent oxidoreductase [Halieaceae bacterium IMCC14734]|uniref:FAD-dependent oxidoreductase n=1 Tax=Candidatus Litorirhabdus singularis TaxID=2518993 RepID=A0ABT3TJ14_9GAMM|nr:FAD-dependent oxidoreductase [Candidatus Litorirhabdus singularis]MCX2982303.1 FAD-dependent oxidoreductase [Candidatus Litorirhabdus singularis]
MKLLSPTSIGAMSLRNRLVMAPMTTNYGHEDQSPSPRLIEFLRTRARGGVGLITVEVCTVDVQQKYQPQSLTLGDDSFIEAHRRLTDALHEHGAKAQPQITHPGPESMISIYHGGQSVGPSAGVGATHGMPSRELAAAELPAIVEQYAQAARRAREAGYDGIELHAAHAYMLLGCFLSPLKNKRRDSYGADTMENRVRLLVEVLQRIKAVAGADFPVTLRISGFERIPGGRDSYDTAAVASILVAAGVDAFHVSGGVSDPMVSQMICGPEVGDGYNIPAAQAIKNVVDVPVMVVGRFLDPELAEATLQQGKADMIVMGRPLLADPELPNKLAAGRWQDIRRCISCQNCIDSMFLWPTESRMNCAVNAASGRELTLDYQPATEPLHVVVIGAGPAGMEAARVAALRGHRVTLIEQQHRLGGSLMLAATVHSDNQRLLDYLIAQVRRLNIHVELGSTASVARIKALAPDQIIVATGALVELPALPGIDLPNVLTGAQLRELTNGGTIPISALPNWLNVLRRPAAGFIKRNLTPSMLRRVASWWLPLGQRIAVVGDDLAAIELAEFLARCQRQVCILSSASLLAPEIGPKRRLEHEKRLEQLQVSINTGVNVAAISADGVTLQLTAHSTTLVAADHVIVTGSAQADGSLVTELEAAGITCRAIGDCTGLGLIVKAIAEGNAAAHAI